MEHAGQNADRPCGHFVMRLFPCRKLPVAALPLAYIDAEATGQVYGRISRCSYYPWPERRCIDDI
jgi:hypothetical protein